MCVGVVARLSGPGTGSDGAHHLVLNGAEDVSVHLLLLPSGGGSVIDPPLRPMF